MLMEIWVQKPRLTRSFPKLAGVNVSEKIGWSRTSHKIDHSELDYSEPRKKYILMWTLGKTVLKILGKAPGATLLFDVSYPNYLIF